MNPNDKVPGTEEIGINIEGIVSRLERLYKACDLGSENNNAIKGDGKLEGDELVFLYQVLNKTKVDEEMREIIRKEAPKGIIIKEVLDKARAVFDAYDINPKDGHLTKNEQKGMGEALEAILPKFNPQKKPAKQTAL